MSKASAKKAEEAHKADWGRLLDGKKFTDRYSPKQSYEAKAGGYYLYSDERGMYFHRRGTACKDGVVALLFTEQYKAAKKFPDKVAAAAFARKFCIPGVRPHPCPAQAGGWRLYSE